MSDLDSLDSEKVAGKLLAQLGVVVIKQTTNLTHVDYHEPVLNISSNVQRQWSQQQEFRGFAEQNRTQFRRQPPRLSEGAMISKTLPPIEAQYFPRN